MERRIEIVERLVPCCCYYTPDDQKVERAFFLLFDHGLMCVVHVVEVGTHYWQKVSLKRNQNVARSGRKCLLWRGRSSWSVGPVLGRSVGRSVRSNGPVVVRFGWSVCPSVRSSVGRSVGLVDLGDRSFGESVGPVVGRFGRSVGRSGRWFGSVC